MSASPSDDPTTGIVVVDIDQGVSFNSGSSFYGTWSGIENLISFAAVAQTIIGNSADNTLTASVYDDSLIGEDGDDVLYGGSGDDYLFGGNDKDKLYGGDHIDVLTGGDAQDKLFGGGGVDTILAAMVAIPSTGMTMAISCFAAMAQTS
jgi:Ca2+-binding RTX toxin-like protein